MTNLLKRFRKNESGAALIEYALLVALIALIAVLAIQGVGSNVNSAFTSINTKLSDAITASAR